MIQQTLFDDQAADLSTPKGPPRNARVTRSAANVAIKPLAAGLRRRVYDFILSRRELGATDGETQTALDMRGSTQRPRRKELQEAGLIRDSGTIRPTASGRASVVWVAIPEEIEE